MSIDINKLTYNTVREAILKKGYSFFTGELNINLVGIRTSSRKADNFDDYFCLVWQENGFEKILVLDEFTTDPGIYYLQTKLLNPNGCAILKPGQYKGVWQIGKHNGKYKAFVQTGNAITVYRDRDKDNILEEDPKTLETGYFGINGHHGYDAIHVGPNSAGCQVFRHDEDLNQILLIAEKSAAKYGNKFTYTLIEEKDLI